MRKENVWIGIASVLVVATIAIGVAYACDTPVTPVTPEVPTVVPEVNNTTVVNETPPVVKKPPAPKVINLREQETK